MLTLRPQALGLLLGLVVTTVCADNCEPLRDQIEAKYRAGGLPNVRLSVMEAASVVAGMKVVGTCGLGARRIVMMSADASNRPVQAASASGAAVTRRRPDNIPTECKDGSVSMTGSCRK